jgi:hypothetical protein
MAPKRLSQNWEAFSASHPRSRQPLSACFRNRGPRKPSRDRRPRPTTFASQAALPSLIFSAIGIAYADYVHERPKQCDINGKSGCTVQPSCPFCLSELVIIITSPPSNRSVMDTRKGLAILQYVAAMKKPLFGIAALVLIVTAGSLWWVYNLLDSQVAVTIRRYGSDITGVPVSLSSAHIAIADGRATLRGLSSSTLTASRPSMLCRLAKSA